jgi:hypothetical protein
MREQFASQHAAVREVVAVDLPKKTLAKKSFGRRKLKRKE